MSVVDCCVLCNKDLKQFAQPHEPCGTISSVVVRASPAMEALMGKLGPQAPPTSSAEEVGLVNPTLGNSWSKYKGGEVLFLIGMFKNQESVSIIGSFRERKCIHVERDWYSVRISPLCNKDVKQFSQPHEPCGTFSSVG